MSQISIEKTYQAALDHHRNGQLSQAEALYGQILAQQPAHAGALHYLGLIAQQVGRSDISVQLIRQSIAIHSGDATAWYNLGNALAGTGAIEQAIAAYRRAIELDPSDALYYNNLGNLLKSTGNVSEAVVIFRKAVALNPNLPEAQNNLGITLQELGEFDAAIAACRRAIALKHDLAEAHNSLGNALQASGRMDEAIAVYRHAIILSPQNSKVFNNLGNALQSKGLLGDAIAVYHKAIALMPSDPDYYNNLGNAHALTGQLEDAIAAYQHAITLKPDYPQALNNLCRTLNERGNIDDAIAAARQAIALDPGFSEPHTNLANSLMQIGELDQGILEYRAAIDLAPRDASIHSNLLFTIHYVPKFDANAIAREAAVWNRKHAEPLRKFIQPHSNERNPNRKLRIGYVSPDLRGHPAGRFIFPLFEHHDRQLFEVFAYAHVLAPDLMTRQFQSHVDHWRSTVGLSDAAVADQIRADKIDILIDLAMHTAHNRLLVFAHKPAPLQATWFPSTSGMSTIDYRLTDPYFDPPGNDDPYTEQSIHLKSFWCFQPRPAPEVNPLPAIENGYITFGSLNNFAKINSQVLSTWIRIMQAIPNSRLLLKSHSGSHQNSIHDLFQTAGISRERVEFIGRRPEREYFENYHRIDIGLDPFPFNGHTTSFDFLWMGVPVITLAGRTAIGRAGASVLSLLGLTNLIAKTPDEYVDLSVQISTDLPALAELRATLRQRMLASPLMDAPGYARDIEAAYRNIWVKWCANKGC